MFSYAVQPLPSYNYLRNSWIWPRLVQLARSTICYTLEHTITQGIVVIVDCNHVSHRFGTTTKTNRGNMECLLYVHDETFWVRAYLAYDIGFSEAYMNGEITTPSMRDLLTLYVYNFKRATTSWSMVYRLKRAADVIIHRFLSHGFQQSVENIAAYDASNELYVAFLSSEMQYSCPIWLSADGGPDGDLLGHRSDGDLERAQSNKIDWVLKKARVQPGHHILEIGTGWGSLAIAAAQLGCTVDTITLSIEQKLLAEQRIEAVGLTAQITVHLLDYRRMPPHFEKAFDACVSLEMIEAVGVEYIPTFIKILDWALKDENAAVVLSATSYPDSTFTEFQGDDFVRKYHWPHTIPPSTRWLVNKFKGVSGSRFVLDSVEDHALHYCRCLREWSRRFEQNWGPELFQSLQKRYPEFRNEHTLNIYKRRWLYMFVYMEVAYSHAWLKLNYWTFTREG